MRHCTIASSLVYVFLVSCAGGSDGAAAAATDPISTSTILRQIPRSPTFSATTVPAKGDVNPYGIAFVPDVFPSGGTLSPGDIVVANFNNSQNLQGTGTTVVRMARGAQAGAATVFFADSSQPGFSTALGALSSGFIVLGNVPSVNGSGICDDLDTDVGAGSLTIINRSGQVATRLVSTTSFNGPWDLTVSDNVSTASVFVANVKDGTVTRLDLAFAQGSIVSTLATRIASGFPHRCDPGAFVVGPTGLAFDRAADVLYVASTDENAIFAVPNAGTTATDQGKGTLVVQDARHFHGPLGLARAQSGDLISAQGDAVNFDKSHPSEIVEIAPAGTFLSGFSIDHAPGSAFGLALEETAAGSRFAAVDDGKNVLDVWAF